MNRRIRFRGIPINGQSFVYGYYNSYEGEIETKHEIITHGSGNTKHEVLFNTICQYAGLVDCNGCEIYEGDIISYIGCDGIKYTQTCPDLAQFHFWQETEDNESRTIIGNIHENKKCSTQ